ncbi:SulP family inorganic anion transporter, partial [Mesorhizobium sp.]|uniref:SulP family inorganic anion transporter n=1 Tax=Mesorhizobium sp. TaxID=1871066 RepID=UPI0025C19A13
AGQVSARIPAALIGMVLATLGVVSFDLRNRGVEVLGALPNGLPPLGMPTVHFHDAQALVPLALLIAIVVMVQTAATSRSFASQNGEAPDVNRDFVGVGAGSIVAALFGAFAVNASPPRTAIVAQTGGPDRGGYRAGARRFRRQPAGQRAASGPCRRADVRGPAYPALEDRR